MNFNTLNRHVLKSIICRKHLAVAEMNTRFKGTPFSINTFPKKRKSFGMKIYNCDDSGYADTRVYSVNCRETTNCDMKATNSTFRILT
jgi:hypothetical protein